MATMSAGGTAGQNVPSTLDFDRVWLQDHSPLFSVLPDFWFPNRQDPATQELGTGVEQDLSAENGSERARALPECRAMAHVQSQAAPWTDAIHDFVRQAAQGVVNLPALAEVHAMLGRLIRLGRSCPDGELPAGLVDAVRQLLTVQHPVWPLHGLRRQAQEVIKRWE